MQEPQRTLEEVERMEQQNAEFLKDLNKGNRRAAKMQQKLPVHIGNRKQRRIWQAQIRRDEV